MIHTCTRCDLRFRSQAEVKEHLQLDHDLDVAALGSYPTRAQRPLYTEPEDASAIRRLLVVANQTLRSPELLEAVQERASRGACHVVAAVPATHSAHLLDRRSYAAIEAPAPSGSDDAGVAQASWRLRGFLDDLRSRGIDAEGSLGPADPYEAAGVELSQRRFDEVLVSTLPPGLSRWFGTDVAARIRRRFGVEVAVLQASAPVSA